MRPASASKAVEVTQEYVHVTASEINLLVEQMINSNVWVLDPRVIPKGSWY